MSGWSWRPASRTGGNTPRPQGAPSSVTLFPSGLRLLTHGVPHTGRAAPSVSGSTGGPRAPSPGPAPALGSLGSACWSPGEQKPLMWGRSPPPTWTTWTATERRGAVSSTQDARGPWVHRKVDTGRIYIPYFTLDFLQMGWVSSLSSLLKPQSGRDRGSAVWPACWTEDRSAPQ